MTRVLGLDLSLTAPGFALPVGQPHTSKTDGLSGTERLGAIRDAVIQAVTLFSVDVVVMEGYSFNSKFSHSHALGELGGVVKLWLAENETPFAIAPPTLVKKFATGKGNANKFQMMTAAMKRAPEVAFSDDNAVDAWWLQQMGVHHYAPSACVSLPVAQTSVADVMEWPDVSTLEEAS